LVAVKSRYIPTLTLQAIANLISVPTTKTKTIKKAKNNLIKNGLAMILILALNLSIGKYGKYSYEKKEHGNK
jgi:hypothetical protein